MIQIEFKLPSGIDPEILSDSLFEESALSVTLNSDGSDSVEVLFQDELSCQEAFQKKLIPKKHVLRKITDADWKNKWLENYSGEKINRNIFIRPFGVKHAEDSNYETVIELNPNDAFGDGHHPTTRMCLILLDEILKSEKIKTHSEMEFLDIGTGTGVLGIFALKKGIKNVEMFDYDGISVERAAENLRINGYSEVIPFQQDLYFFDTPRRFDLVSANVLSVVLIDNMDKIKGLLSDSGIAVLSGVNMMNSSEVEEKIISSGLFLKKKLVEDDWCAYLVAEESF